MWEQLFWPILRVFGLAWDGDDRPEARWFSVGCLVVVVAVMGIVAFRYSR